jgi:hypothetical protein
MSAKHGTGIVEMFESLVREVAQVGKPPVQERVVEIVTPDVVQEKKAGWRCC